MSEMVPGGWPEVRRRNRALALEGRRILCDALEIPPPAPEDMIGALASMPLPRSELLPGTFSPLTPLQETLRRDHGIEPQVYPFPGHSDYLLRISAQLYNTRAQFERLADLLVELL